MQLFHTRIFPCRRLVGVIDEEAIKPHNHTTQYTSAIQLRNIYTDRKLSEDMQADVNANLKSIIII